MSHTFIFLIPLVSALISWLSAKISIYLLIVWVLPRQINALKIAFRTALQGSQTKQLLDSIDFIKELDPILDRKLDHYIQKLFEKIPLGKLFIKTNFMEEMKLEAKQEFFSAIPEIKASLLDRIPIQLDPFIEQRLVSKGKENYTWVNSYLYFLYFSCASVGFILGLILSVVLLLRSWA